MDTATPPPQTQAPPEPLDGLLPHHQRMLLEESGLAPDVVRRRGYRSIEDRAELRRLGFKQTGLTVPGLLLPGYGPDGSNGRYVYRPDVPRVGPEGQPRKYELPAGSAAFLDVPPVCAARLRDPSVDLWVTEGQKKGDALASTGKCAVALLGVWMWRGKNEYGAATSLPEWGDVALRGRRVHVPFDSDAKHKPGVWQAMGRFKGWLESRGATVVLVDVPDAEDGGKQGIDEYLRRFPVAERGPALEQLAQRPAPVFDGETFEWLDEPPPVLARPLALVAGRAYAAAWISGKRRTVDDDGRWLERDEVARVLVRDDGEVFGPGGADPAALGVAVQLAQPIREYHGWRAPAIKAFRAGHRPDVPDVFRRLVATYDHFLDFPRSPGGQDRQGIMCELSACFSFATWLTPALTVVGYPWPNGPAGSGKTKWATIWARTSYLGEVVLSSGTFASIRDLADYGGALAFDDAEGLADPKKADPYKRELLLAGHHKGAVIPLKEPEPDGKGWATRFLDPFGFKAFTAIKLPDQVLSSRSVIIPLVRTASEKGNRDPAAVSRWPHDRRQLQDDLWATAVRVLPSAAERWAALDGETTLIGRDFEPWRPVLLAATVLEAAGVTGLVARIRAAMGWYQDEKADLTLPDRTILVIRALLSLLAERAGDSNDSNDSNDSILEWSVGDITDAVKAQGTEEGIDDTDWMSPAWVGRVLSQLRFQRERDKKRRYYRLTRAAIVTTATAYGLGPKPTPPPPDPADGNAVIAVTTPPGGGSGGAAVADGEHADANGLPPENAVIAVTAVILSPAESTDSAAEPLAETCGLCGADVEAYTPDGHARCEAHAHVVYVTDAAGLARELPGLLAAPRLGLDVETTGLSPRADRLRLVQLATGARTVLVDAFAVDVAPLAPLFAGSGAGAGAGPQLVGHNLAFDLGFLAAAGLPLPDGTRLLDTLLAERVGDRGEHFGAAHKGYFTLEAVAKRALGVGLDKTEQAGGWDAPELPPAKLRYAGRDAEILLPLADAVQGALEEAGLTPVARLECEALPVVVWTEATGVPLDVPAWTALAERAEAALAPAREALVAHAASLTPGGDGYLDVVAPYTPAQLAPTKTGAKRKLPDRAFNPASAVQQLRLLAALGVPLPNTQEATLEANAQQHPAVADLLAAKRVEKYATTFGRAYVAKHVDPATGRVHGRYFQLGTVAGRMSAGTPNVQQVPHARAYRDCVRAPAGRVLIKADYSQIELRIIAEVAGDDRMLDALNGGADLHRLTAAAIFGVPEGDVTPQQRAFGKTLNFGVMYGMGAARLVRSLAEQGVTLSEAQARAYIAKFNAQWRGVERWRRDQMNRPEPMVVTAAGRQRLLEPDAPATERINTPIQGLGADILKAALAELWATRDRCPSGAPILLVHDEVVIEVDEAEAEAGRAWVTEAMRAGGRRYLSRVAVEVEATAAPTWGGPD